MSSQYYFENYCLFLFCHSYTTFLGFCGLWPHSSCQNNQVTSNMAPAHPHVTGVAVYPALFFLSCVPMCMILCGSFFRSVVLKASFSSFLRLYSLLNIPNRLTSPCLGQYQRGIVSALRVQSSGACLMTKDGLREENCLSKWSKQFRVAGTLLLVCLLKESHGPNWNFMLFSRDHATL